MISERITNNDDSEFHSARTENAAQVGNALINADGGEVNGGTPAALSGSSGDFVPAMHNLYNGAEVIGEIENRRPAVSIARNGDAFETNPDTLEINSVGTPELFKAAVLRGYYNNGGWQDPDNPNSTTPTNWQRMTYEEEIEHINDLTLLREDAEEQQKRYCLQATWDWVRAKYVPPLEN